MSLERALDVAEQDLDWIVERAVGWQKNRHNTTAPEVMNDLRIAMDASTI
jgi:hypothetical protein